MRALVGVDSLQIDHVADDLEFFRDAVATMHVTRNAGDIKRLPAVIALDQRDHLRREGAFIHQSADTQACLQPECDLRRHVSQFLLVQLGRGERAGELPAIQSILARRGVAGFRGPHRTPGNPVASPIEATKRPFETFDIRQQLVFRYEDIVHVDHAGDRRSQADLALDLRCGEPLHSLVEYETANGATMRFGFCPNDEHIRDR